MRRACEANTRLNEWLRFNIDGLLEIHGALKLIGQTLGNRNLGGSFEDIVSKKKP